LLTMEEELTFGFNDKMFHAKTGKRKAAILKYKLENNTMHLILTYTLRKFRGKGIASKLVEYAINYALEQKVHILKISCSYVKSWLKKHPEYMKKFYKIIYEVEQG